MARVDPDAARLTSAVTESKDAWSAEEIEAVLGILANFHAHKLGPGLWFALDPTANFTTAHGDYVLAHRLQPLLPHGPDTLLPMLKDQVGKRLQAASFIKALSRYRDDPAASTSPLLVFRDSSTCHGGRVACIAFGAEPSLTPDEQLEAEDAAASSVSSLKATHDAIATSLRRKTLRSEGPAVAMPSSPASARTSTSFVPTPQEEAPAAAASSHPTVASILAALKAPTPYCSADGQRLPSSLLARSFQTGLEDMSPTSAGRRQLMQAASAVVFHVLSLLAPSPLATAAALAQLPPRGTPDGLRGAISQTTVPRGPRLLQMLSEQPVVQSLVCSYICTAQRNEKAHVKAQVLAPLSRQFSRRSFNDLFGFMLREAKLKPLTLHVWRGAAWHEKMWGAGQTPLLTQTERWHIRGVGDLQSLPHPKLVAAVEFLASTANLQHTAYGTRRVRMSDGSWLDLSETQRTQCAEALWELYKKEMTHQISRTTFLELANLVADKTQKSYGALDTYAEQNGRLQAIRLRELCDELEAVARRLLALLPPDDEGERASALSAAKHASALKLKVSQVEEFIKHGMHAHHPACNAAKPPDDEATCPEHCPTCAFGSDSSDGSRPRACNRKHSTRCVQCAMAHSLEPDFDVLLNSVGALVEAAVAAAATGAVAGGGEDDGAMDVDTGVPRGGAERRHPVQGTQTDPHAQLPAAAAGGTAAAAPSTVEAIREQWVEVKTLSKRALKRFSAFFAHERRAAHESGVMDMLLRELDETGCVLVADWKMKFLSASFREAMSDFFGKAGMPWHGVMLIRRAHGDEARAEGEYVVSYVDAQMLDKREDGFATLSAIELALKTYKRDCPWITHAAVKTDGAGAYAGLVCTVGLSLMQERAGIRVTDHYIGEAGKGKSQLDGHFGVKGTKLRRLVAAALNDIITPEMLHQGIVKTLGTNEVAQLFQPDRSRGSGIDAVSIPQLSSQSHREYVYEADGELASLLLRQQTNLGDGLSVEASKLRKPGATAFGFAAPKLVSESGTASCCAAADCAAACCGDADGDDEDAAAAAAESIKPAAAAQGKLPSAYSKAGREAKEREVAKRRTTREEKAVQFKAIERAARVERCQQSTGYWCCTDAEGNPDCNFTSMSAKAMRKHVADGKHTAGLVRWYATGVAAGRGTAHDRNVKLATAAIEAVAMSSDRSASMQPAQLQPADGFSLVFADGISRALDVPEGGWARAQRLPTERCSVAQLEFVWEAYTIGQTPAYRDVKLSAATAHELMKTAGTSAAATQWSENPYFGVVMPTPRFSRLQILDAVKLKGYFGKPKAYLERLLQNARKKGVVDEEDDDDEDGDADGEQRKKRKKRRGAATGGGGSGGGGGGRASSVAIVGGAALTRATPISALSAKLVKGLGPKKLASYEVARAAAESTAAPLPTTSGELAERADELMTFKVDGIGAKTWRALLLALQAHFASVAAAGAANPGPSDLSASGSGGQRPSGGGAAAQQDGGGREAVLPDALAELTHAHVATMPTHGFASKLVKAAAHWPRCQQLAKADLSVANAKLPGVSAAWLQQLQQAVAAALPAEATPAAVLMPVVDAMDASDDELEGEDGDLSDDGDGEAADDESDGDDDGDEDELDDEDDDDLGSAASTDDEDADEEDDHGDDVEERVETEERGRKRAR